MKPQTFTVKAWGVVRRGRFLTNRQRFGRDAIFANMPCLSAEEHVAQRDADMLGDRVVLVSVTSTVTEITDAS